MISIQSLVMVEEPWFNEPGREDSYKTDEGKKISKNYNEQVRLNCMKWAMIDMIRNPTPSFENAILTHFKLKADHIKETCARWVTEASSQTKTAYQETYQELCTELDNLSNS